jgi:polyphosphate:AMP phosphotransferase
MLETVDLDAKLSKAEFKKTHEALGLRLGRLQRDIRVAGIPVVIVFEGWEASGVGTAIGRLLTPLDPRGYKVYTFGLPTETEKLYPPMWRFWRTVSPRGGFAVYDGSWYIQVLERNKANGSGRAGRERIYERIRAFERQITDDGAVVVKFWLHISQQEQARRFKKMKKDPALAWKVSDEDWRRHHEYDKACRIVEEMLDKTSTVNAPWTVVPSHDPRYAGVTVGQAVAAALETALANKKRATARRRSVQPVVRRDSPLDRVDLSLSLKRGRYECLLPRLQKDLLRLEHLIYPYRIPVVVVYEGWDAAGKGGNIKRFVSNLDHRGFEVVPIGSPEGDERTHHYLWRFWKSLPKGGHITVFDRSWYGRVMVERIEGFAAPNEWRRAYQEINEFEEGLTSYGTVLVKFWIHISKQEQIRRFREREKISYKQWKITPEDWRNRKKWDEYYTAVSDMIEKTSTAHAPWTIIEGNDKLYARIKTLKTVSAAIANALARVKAPGLKTGKK